MIVIRNILSIITDPKNTRMFLLGGIVVLCILFLRQCQATAEAKGEATRIENNWKASLDEIENYINEKGNAEAEVMALNLTIDELEEDLRYEKNKPPITIIETKTVIKEVIVEVPVTVIDTVIGNFSSAFEIKDSATWGNSFREIGVIVPYEAHDSTIDIGNATIDLSQNIWLTASILRDRKTKEVFVNLETDYPGTTFNSAQGILIDQNSKGFLDLQKQNRKTLGIGLQLGVGYGNNGFTPYVGIGLGYTPKFLQW